MIATAFDRLATSHGTPIHTAEDPDVTIDAVERTVLEWIDQAVEYGSVEVSSPFLRTHQREIVSALRQSRLRFALWTNGAHELRLRIWRPDAARMRILSAAMRAANAGPTLSEVNR